ncbi:hypothetical protein GW17_00025385, partial [Ensete ventricosum]
PLPLLVAVAFPSSATEITLSHITPLLPSSSSASHVVMIADASCSHTVVDRHCPFPSPLRCFPLRFDNSFCNFHHLPFQPSLAPTSTHFLYSYTKYNVTDAMTMDDALDVRFKASEARIEDKLQELLREFKRNRFEKYDQGQDTGYPRKEFPRWEDGDPTGWISRVEKFFHFHKSLEEYMVKIASAQFKGDAIQWYDLYETYHGVPSWGQFKRELLSHFGPT